MIKKLDWLIIKGFIGPFIVTFFVTLFVLVMQFFWLYMDELIGKGLGIGPIMQLLLYMSTTLVPLALPLAVLLASIMTFGAFGENFELVAIKSAGISLNRFMRPLLVAIAFLAFGAFLFNNYVIPVANLKALSLLYDLRNSKPTLNIRAGQFNNDIENFSIRVGEKDKDGKTIRNVMVYDHTSGNGDDNIVVAKDGKMMPSPDNKMLIFRLQDGWRYEEGSVARQPGRTQIRMHFQRWDKVFDLSGFKVNRTNQDLFAGDQKMMSLSQLSERIDSLHSGRKRAASIVKGYVGPYLMLISDAPDALKLRAMVVKSRARPAAYATSITALAPDSLRAAVIQNALNNSKNAQQLVDISATNSAVDEDKLLKFDVEWHRKLTMAIACVLLFLIGAPLGAIIRKGGLGMPMLVAIGLFLVWYILSFMGEKLVTGGALSPLVGMWGATAILFPLALYLIRQAKNDSPVLRKESYSWLAGAVRKRLTFKRSQTEFRA